MKRVLACAVFGLLASSSAAVAQDEGDGVDDLPGMEDDAPVDEGDDTSSAAADMEPPSMDEPTTSASAEGGSTRLTLPKGQLFAQGFLEINLSKNSAFKPVSIRPDVWYGVTNEITAGFVHSSRALTGFLVDTIPGGGLCLGDKSGDDISCFRGTYTNVGLLGRYHLLSSPVVLAADGGFIINDFSDFQLALKLGVVGEWQSDKLAVLFGLNFAFGLTNRDPANKDFFNLPVSVMYRVIPKLMAGVQTGFRTPFSDAGDNYSIPLSLGARYLVSDKIIVDGSFGLPLLFTGIPDASGVAARVLSLGVGYVF